MTLMNQKEQRGLTFSEMIVATTIFSLSMVMVSQVLRGGAEQLRTAETKMNLQESARESLYRMGLEIREASAARTAVTNGGASLTFQIPAGVSNSGTVTWSSPITYQVGGSGSQLIRLDTGTGQSTVLANDIQSILFTASGNPPDTVTYRVTAQHSLANGRNLSVISTGEAKLRNG